MSYNTIKIKKYSDIIEEYEANAAITPGMLVEVMSTDKVRAHNTAGGTMIPMFALEDELQGGEITDDYAAADQVQVWVAGRGDVVYAILADEQNVAIGDWLVSNGDGRLKLATTTSSAGPTEYPNSIVGQALEALDLSGLSAGDSSLTPLRQHLKVRIV